MGLELKETLDRIADLRGQMRALIADLPPDVLNWRPVDGDDNHATNSLAVLAAHAVGAEHFWIGEVVGGLPTTRKRESEFQTVVDSVAPLLARIDETAAETDAVFARLDMAELERLIDVRGHQVTGRWAILHVIDHTALHLGHMQLTCQLWNSGAGVDAPRWFQRLPKS